MLGIQSQSTCQAISSLPNLRALDIRFAPVHSIDHIIAMLEPGCLPSLELLALDSQHVHALSVLLLIASGFNIHPL